MTTEQRYALLDLLEIHADKAQHLGWEKEFGSSREAEREAEQELHCAEQAVVHFVEDLLDETIHTLAPANRC